jgi:hypothetical protein
VRREDNLVTVPNTDRPQGEVQPDSRIAYSEHLTNPQERRHILLEFGKIPLLDEGPRSQTSMNMAVNSSRLAAKSPE